MLKVAEKTVYSTPHKAQLPAFKVGGQWRFKRADLQHWIEDQNTSAHDDRSPGDV